MHILHKQFEEKRLLNVLCKPENAEKTWKISWVLKELAHLLHLEMQKEAMRGYIMKIKV